MARCPACRRRLLASAACPRDGALAPAELAAAPEPPPAIPGLAIGERIGSGGYATTWAAQRGDTAAIVKLSHRSGPVPSERFAREHDALRRLAGTVAPAPLALGELDGRPYILMARTPGVPLAAVLATATGPLGAAEALALAEALCSGLAGIHARGFAHADLKPENLIVDRDRVGIVDLGVARADGERAPPPGVGTIEYMAPEQLTGEPAAEPGAVHPAARADVYAVGAIVFELLVGHPPFVGDRSSIAFQLRNVRPPRLRELAAVPAALDDLVARCLDKRPAARPADAHELLDALRAIRRDADAAAPAVPERAQAAAAASRATCALVAVEPREVAAIARVTELVHSHGGALARRRGNRLVFAFEPGRHLLPPRAAAEAAAAVATPERGATVHVATLTVRRRADGTAAYFGDELERLDGWVSTAAGVALTEPAAAALAPFVLDAPRPMIGRDAVLAALHEVADRVLAGEGPGCVAITGAPGLGKTMVLDAFRSATRLPHVVSLAVGPPLVGGPPNAARELLERLPPSDDVDELARAAATWILDPRSDRAIARLRAAPGALRAATARALASGLTAAAHRPTLLAIDDAHLADGAVLDALAAATRGPAGAPLLVVAAGRPELARDAPELVARAPLARSLELAPLDRAAGAALARSLLAPADPIPEAAIARLVARTQGHPLELVELAAAVRRRGAIRQSERGRWELDLAVVDQVLDQVPGSHLFRWFAEQALADLPPALLAHAELVALLGGDVSARDVRDAIGELDRSGDGGRYPLDAERGLELLREAGVLVRSSEHAAAPYRFRQALLADLREAVPAEHARAVHGAAFAALARRDDLAPDVRLARRAFHAHHAGRAADAGSLYRELGTLALARHRYADAELALTRALDAGDPGPVHWQRGIARYRMGRHDAAAADFELGRAAARACGDRAREAEILLDEAMSLDWAAEFRASARAVEAAAALLEPAAAGDPVAPRLRAYLAMSAGRSHIRANREPDAIEPLEQAIALAAPLGDECYEILVVALLQSAPILATWGRHDEARRQFDQVLALTAAAGDRLHHCAALANRLWRPFATPDVAALRRDHDTVLAIAAELGHFIIEFTGEVNFAGALHHLGHPALALAHARRAVELERARLGDAARPEAALLLARILAAAHRHAEVAAVVAELDAHQQVARAAQRTEALLTPADRVLLDGVRFAARVVASPYLAPLLADAERLLPRHELAELRALVGYASPGSSSSSAGEPRP